MPYQRRCRKNAVICILKMWGQSLFLQACLLSLSFLQFRATVVTLSRWRWDEWKFLSAALQCCVIQYNCNAIDKECNKENQDCISICALVTLLTTSKCSHQWQKTFSASFSSFSFLDSGATIFARIFSNQYFSFEDQVKCQDCTIEDVDQCIRISPPKNLELLF